MLAGLPRAYAVLRFRDKYLLCVRTVKIRTFWGRVKGWGRARLSFSSQKRGRRVLFPSPRSKVVRRTRQRSDAGRPKRFLFHTWHQATYKASTLRPSPPTLPFPTLRDVRLLPYFPSWPTKIKDFLKYLTRTGHGSRLTSLSTRVPYERLITLYSIPAPSPLPLTLSSADHPPHENVRSALK